MNGIFTNLVNMSISASILAGIVLILRFVLKSAPRWIFVLLWGIVAIRLVCPVTLESNASLMPATEWVSVNAVTGPVVTPIASQTDTSVPSIPTHPDIQAPEYTATGHEPFVEEEPVTKTSVLPYIWLAGIAVMLVYAVVSFVRLYRRVSDGVKLRDRVYQSEKTASPFVLGFFKPRIFIPYSLKAESTEYVIAHEMAHIRRHDHWWKPLGYLLLSLHWFNPVMWVAYVLLCRDIESACDEKVVRDMSIPERADYSEALLGCSVKARGVSACPLAFGETGVKSRIKSVLSYKKPAFWVIIISLLLCVGLVVFFLTSPEGNKDIAKNTELGEITLIDRIVSREGYCVIEQRFTDISLGIHTARIMPAVTEGVEYEFLPEQRPAYLADGTQIYLKRVSQVKGDDTKLILTFDFEHSLDENGGSFLSPWTLTDNDTYLTVFNVANRKLYGVPNDYDNAVLTAGQGPDFEISVYVLKEALRHTGDDAVVVVTLNQLTYLKDYERRTLSEDELIEDARLVASVTHYELEEGSVRLHTGNTFEAQFDSADGIHTVGVKYSKKGNGWMLDETPVNVYIKGTDYSAISRKFPTVSSWAVSYASEIGDRISEEQWALYNGSRSATITELKKLSTSSQEKDEGVELYYMTYWIGKGINGPGWTDEYKMFSRYFALHVGRGEGDGYAAINLGDISVEEFNNTYNTEAMISRYGSAYTAAAMELYQNYLYSGKSGVSATQSMEDKILDAYNMATEVASWFRIESMSTNWNDYVDIGDKRYYKTVQFETRRDLRDYLESYFSVSVVDELLSNDMYIDYNGKLYSTGGARGADLFKGRESYLITRVNDTKYLLNVIVEIYGNDAETVEDYEEFIFTYENVSGRGVFTSFPSIR